MRYVFLMAGLPVIALGLLFHYEGSNLNRRLNEKSADAAKLGRMTNGATDYIFTADIIALERKIKEKSAMGWICFGIGAALCGASRAFPASNKVKTQEKRFPCPECGELIMPTASFCRFCNAVLSDRERRKMRGLKP